ncbi:ABC transporter ATP-binding protein [Halobacteria archaeon AArc-m2/3/4]|uniref:Nickel import system ATP-binding protein NikD n=1 Tax=Natronoglomus mannanivorans TaxID=2979990 RepID=A0ABT2QBF4_9EURY|nr:ABC transporter ATP-binding protein [Halobacteria archaeon AArc-m2/3/4]
MNQNTILSVDGLRTHFYTEQGVVRAVDDISFDVRQGEIVGIVGESGAGKSVATTSILRLIEEPGEIVAGEITYQDTTIVGFDERSDGTLVPKDEMLTNRQMRSQVRGNEIAIIFQDPMESLNPVYTVGNQLQEFIELNRDLSGSAAKKEGIDVLREVGIPEPEARFGDYPHEFSGGMRQRVLIAMALACRPNLIIADEPTTALDVTVEGQILNLVSDLQEEYGTSFIWVTHDMGVVAEICDRVNVMYLGKIVEQGPVDEIFYDTKHPYTKALLESVPRPDRTVDELNPIVGTMPSAIDPPRGCRFHTRCPDAREACREVDPQFVDVSETPDTEHRTACIKYDDVGYWDSVPLEHASEQDTSYIDEDQRPENRDLEQTEGEP